MKAFYDSIRASLFAGTLSQSQVSSIDMILAKCKAERVTAPAQVAYILATAYHEVGSGMLPRPENLNYSAQALANNWPHRYAVNPKAAVKVPNTLALKLHRNPVAIANNCYADRMGNGNEASGDGWRFRGQDFCQTTGRDNYRRAGQYSGVDLEKHPERISELATAATNLVVGMRDGWFTGKRLSTYLSGYAQVDADAQLKKRIAARYIINGQDKAALVAWYAQQFLTGLVAAKF